MSKETIEATPALSVLQAVAEELERQGKIQSILWDHEALAARAVKMKEVLDWVMETRVVLSAVASFAGKAGTKGGLHERTALAEVARIATEALHKSHGLAYSQARPKTKGVS